jgi:hypothetical protein
LPVARAARRARSAYLKGAALEGQALLRTLARDLAPAGGSSLRGGSGRRRPGGGSSREPGPAPAAPAASERLAAAAGAALVEDPARGRPAGGGNAHGYPPLASLDDGSWWGHRSRAGPWPRPHPEDPFGLLGAEAAAAARFFDDVDITPEHM